MGENMKKILICLFALFAVAACDRDDGAPIFQCGDYDVQMEIAETGDAMRANLNGDDVDLALVPAASGAKYAGVLNDTVVVLWQKGDAWTLMLDDEQIIDCKSK